MMFAAFAKTLVPLLIVFPGLLVLVLHAQMEYPDMAMPWVVKNVLAAVLMWNDLNMLYVAFLTFCYSMAALWITGHWTQRLTSEELSKLVYGRG